MPRGRKSSYTDKQKRGAHAKKKISTRRYRSASFDYSRSYADIDFRAHPERYQIGRGEQGVLMVEPYKSEILPHWRFKNPALARDSSRAIYKLYQGYKKQKDFVGMDMTRKFLQMGYTRARRYANHASGRKYETNPQKEPAKAKERAARTRVRPQETDWATNEKAQSARIFYEVYVKVRGDPVYKGMKEAHRERFES